MPNETSSRIPNFGKLTIAIIEHLVKPIIGEQAIKEIKFPYVERQLRDSIVKALSNTEQRFVREHSDQEVTEAILSFPLANLPSVIQAAQNFYSQPADNTLERVLNEQLANDFANTSPERLRLGVSSYLSIFREELAVLSSEFRERLSAEASISIQSNIDRIEANLGQLNQVLSQKTSYDRVKEAKSALNSGETQYAISVLKNAIEIAHKSGVPLPEAEDLLSSFYGTLEELKTPKIFISYSRSDFSFATEIYWFLRNSGCNPWMDIYDLVPGQDWALEIRHNIKSADFFIACLSKNSVSKRGFIQKELKEAISVLEERPEGEIYIIPIRIDECLVPDSLASRHWLDWFTSNAKEILLKAIKHK